MYYIVIMILTIQYYTYIILLHYHNIYIYISSIYIYMYHPYIYIYTSSVRFQIDHLTTSLGELLGNTAVLDALAEA